MDIASKHRAGTTEGPPVRVELDPQTVEDIAQRVVALLLRDVGSDVSHARLLNVGELARLSGVSRSWIYGHAAELGGLRLGDGPKARLRFPQSALERLSTVNAPKVPEPPSPRARPPRERIVSRADLIPIMIPRDMSNRGILRRRSH
jgi:predicted DNA-binding transcriptional regulator AlpA